MAETIGKSNVTVRRMIRKLEKLALHIAVQATKRKKIRNIVGYFDGVCRNLIDKALF